MMDNATTSDPLLPPGGEGSLVDLLDLEHLDRDLFRSAVLFEDHYALYGGQVAAQALRAAGLSVGVDRVPHSLHGYFLRPGDASRPVVFQVFRDRDGGSFSARRVVAQQGGEVIFSMATSFQRDGHGTLGLDETESSMPDVQPPHEARPYRIPRLLSYEARHVKQAWAGLDYPARFWARCTDDLGEDPLLHACVLTYLSDISTGLVRFNNENFESSASLDHAVWFHRPGNAADWTLMDLVPHTISSGRGVYTGSLWAQNGTLVATVAQEALFRRRRDLTS